VIIELTRIIGVIFEEIKNSKKCKKCKKCKKDDFAKLFCLILNKKKI
jgi:hypothetical protein